MMEVLDAFSAENAGVLGAIKMLDSLIVLLAEVGQDFFVLAQVKVACKALLVVDRREQGILSYCFIQDIEVEW